MGKITAAHLVYCLTQAGFVMKKPPPAPARDCPYAKSARRVIDAAARYWLRRSGEGVDAAHHSFP